MRINSNFRDYYDGLSKYDTDYETVFNRFTKEPIIAPFPYDINPYSYGFSKFDKVWNLPKVIGFAGKFYPFIYMTHNHRFYKETRPADQIVYEPTYFKPDPLRSKCRHSFLNFFSTFENVEMFDEYGPVFLMEFRQPGIYPWHESLLERDKVSITVNPRLTDWLFPSIVNPQDAYNELVKWHYNHAFPAKEIPEMSNDIKIEQAGFNLKHSFRKKKDK